MLELIENVVLTTSFLQIFIRLSQMSATDVVLLFLLSKPVFVLMAAGSVLRGRTKRHDHYLGSDRSERCLPR
ncbi:hypothetical protein FRC91_16290 [Bradymonadales bacterium TMQ1]|uniref:Inner membrane protein n=1 Tax=Lujinxingia sediminis TaxID=2480984 RepID=A0ABY0CPY4_9DELT|nr:hypothetical protein [Lujinxingia sediminis]RVU42471.1 hypothetical protein EA187_16470 [Lujinxingia sediminis]TXC74670.1 hypothetical protein FRC91_16290 [Bradymonadales bacterium TMQ1]